MSVLLWISCFFRSPLFNLLLLTTHDATHDATLRMAYVYIVVVDGLTLDAEFDNFTDARAFVLDLYGVQIEKYQSTVGVLTKENRMGITKFESSELYIEIRRVWVPL